MRRIAVVGCGLGGAAISVMLQRSGFSVKVYEQAPSFSRMGAGIHLTPNVIKALQRFGLAKRLVNFSSQPSAFCSRDAFTGEVIAQLPLGAASAELYGAPYLTVHRGDFHAEMVSLIEPASLAYGKRLTKLIEHDGGICLVFEDGSEDHADLVIGADGLASAVRNHVCDHSQPHYSGQAAYRAMVDLDQLEDCLSSIDDLTKWWADDRFIIAYYLDREHNQFYFVAGFPLETWPFGVQSMAADREEMLSLFSDFHSLPRRILASATEVKKWPLYERPAQSAWSSGRIVLLGDACHPMRPHMTQGAAMAIEDGAVLVRCLMAAGIENWQSAYGWYQRARFDRVSKVQQISSKNDWMRTPIDPDWLFSLDAWNFPLFSEMQAETALA